MNDPFTFFDGQCLIAGNGNRGYGGILVDPSWPKFFENTSVEILRKVAIFPKTGKT